MILPVWYFWFAYFDTITYSNILNLNSHIFSSHKALFFSSSNATLCFPCHLYTHFSCCLDSQASSMMLLSYKGTQALSVALSHSIMHFLQECLLLYIYIYIITKFNLINLRLVCVSFLLIIERDENPWNDMGNNHFVQTRVSSETLRTR